MDILDPSIFINIIIVITNIVMLGLKDDFLEYISYIIIKISNAYFGQKILWTKLPYLSYILSWNFLQHPV